MRVVLLSVLFTLSMLSRVQSSGITVQMTASSTEVVVGEPVTITIRAFDPDRFAGIQLVLPSLSNFGQDEPTDVTVSTDVVDGIPQVVYQQQIILYAYRSGTFVVPPARVRLPETPLMSEQLFESQPLVINVRPLPSPRPTGFTNAVGTLTASTQIDRTALEASKTLGLQLIIAGNGNLQVIYPPALLLNLEEWRAMPPRRVLSPDRKRLAFEWTLIPRRSGQLKISTPPFAWYDPTAMVYRTLPSQEIHIAVAPGLPTASVLPTLPVAALVPTSSGTLSIPPLSDADLLRAAAPRLWPDAALWLIPPFISLCVFVAVKLASRPLRFRRRRSPPSADLHSELIRAVQLPPIQAFPLLDAVLQQGLQRYQPPDQALDVWLRTLPEPLYKRILRLRQDLANARYAPASADDVKEWARAVLLVLRQLEAFLERS
jgi:hypothetical protein